MSEHKYGLGTVVRVEVEIFHPGDHGVEVNVKGVCCLLVVGHVRNSEQQPLYILSDLPVLYPTDAEIMSSARMQYRYFANLVEFGYSEETLAPTGTEQPLADTIANWLGRADLRLI